MTTRPQWTQTRRRHTVTRRSRRAAGATSVDGATHLRIQWHRDRDPGRRLVADEVTRTDRRATTTSRHDSAATITTTNRRPRLREEDTEAVVETIVTTRDASIHGRAPARESAIARRVVGYRDATVVTRAARRAGRTATTGSAAVIATTETTEQTRRRTASTLAMRKNRKLTALVGSV